MAKSKRPSASNTKIEKYDPVSRGHLRTGRVHVPKRSCKDHFSVIEPQINAEGVHVWPFDVSCPVDVLFLTEDGRHSVRMNRHGYFEILFLCSGSANCHIQDRLLPFNEGDLAIVGSTLYHRVECQSSAPLTIAALFFEPDLIRCEGGKRQRQNTLRPSFCRQDSEFLAISFRRKQAFPARCWN